MVNVSLSICPPLIYCVHRSLFATVAIAAIVTYSMRINIEQNLPFHVARCTLKNHFNTFSANIVVFVCFEYRGCMVVLLQGVVQQRFWRRWQCARHSRTDLSADCIKYCIVCSILSSLPKVSRQPVGAHESPSAPTSFGIHWLVVWLVLPLTHPSFFFRFVSPWGAHSIFIQYMCFIRHAKQS